jgi:thiol-disulfide isomerase/thioredoxin
MGVQAKSDDNVLSRPQFQYKHVYKEHVRTRKPMIVVLGAEWCGPCRKYKKKVWKDFAEDIVDGKSDYLLAIVDIDKDPVTKIAMLGDGEDTIPYTAVFYFKNGVSMKTSFYKLRSEDYVEDQLEAIDRDRDK